MDTDHNFSSEETIDREIGELGHRVLGALNLGDVSQIKATFEEIKNELMTKVGEHPVKTLIEVAGVGFMLTHLLTSGRANTLRWLARGAGTFAVTHLLDKISSTEIEPHQTRH